jgi:hypothetical protein
VPDNVARVAAALHELDPHLDALAIADALWLSAVWTAGNGDTRQQRAPTSSAPAAAAATVPARAQQPPTTTAHDPPIHDTTPQAAKPEKAGHGRAAHPPAGRSLPRQLELARSLRPFKRRWPAGPSWELDLDATADHYAYTRCLIPAFRRAPERWFEATLVVDRSAQTAVWDSAIQEFTRLLTDLGAFRRIHTWQLRPGDVTNGTAQSPARHRQPAPPDHIGGPEQRRVVLVISDCSAPAWHDPAIWRKLREWAASAPTALINPLPVRLWHHTALDLPTVRAGPGRVGSENSRLRYRVPLLLRLLGNGDQRWIPLPVLTMTPHSLGRWAATLMRADPAGCDAMLIPSTGRLDDPADESDRPTVRQLVDAFRQTAPPTARRLAVLCLSDPHASLASLERIREEVVPEATLTDIAEVVVSGLVHVSDNRNGSDGHGHVALRFREGVPELLTPVPAVIDPIPASDPLPSAAHEPPYAPPEQSETTGRPIQIALWGGPGSGKTTFLHALSVATAPGSAWSPGWVLRDQDDATEDFMRRAKARFTGNRAFPGSTSSMRRIHVEFSRNQPRESRWDWLQFVGSARRRPPRFAVEFIDIPGMAFAGYPKRQVIDWLMGADALIYQFDPTAARTGGGGNLAYFHGTLERLLRLADECGRLDRGRLPHHVAVCVTKLDHPDIVREGLRAGQLVWDPARGYAPSVGDGGAAAFFAWACRLGRNEEIVHDALSTYFHRDRVSYYVTSSVGFRLTADGGYDSADWSNIEWVGDRPRIRGAVRAINVLEPLLDLERKIRRKARA